MPQAAIPDVRLSYRPAGGALPLHLPVMFVAAEPFRTQHPGVTVQVRASTASWVANLPFLDLCQLKQDDTTLFLACFEPQNSNKAAAAYASCKAYQVMTMT